MTTSPAQVADAISDYVANQLISAMDDCGAEWEGDVKEMVSRPVGRQGSRVIRSKPSESVRLEYGDYIKTIRRSTRRAGNKVITEIGSTSKLSDFFRTGTARMKARPDFEKLAERVEGEAAQKIQSKL